MQHARFCLVTLPFVEGIVDFVVQVVSGSAQYAVHFVVCLDCTKVGHVAQGTSQLGVKEVRAAAAIVFVAPCDPIGQSGAGYATDTARASVFRAPRVVAWVAGGVAAVNARLHVWCTYCECKSE